MNANFVHLLVTHLGSEASGQPTIRSILSLLDGAAYDVIDFFSLGSVKFLERLLIKPDSVAVSDFFILFCGTFFVLHGGQPFYVQITQLQPLENISLLYGQNNEARTPRMLSDYGVLWLSSNYRVRFRPWRPQFDLDRTQEMLVYRVLDARE